MMPRGDLAILGINRIQGDEEDLDQFLGKNLANKKSLKWMDLRAKLAVAVTLRLFDKLVYRVGDGEALGVVCEQFGPNEPEVSLVEAVQSAKGGTLGDVARGLNPLWLLHHLPNMAAAQVAIQLGIRGPCVTVPFGDGINGLAYAEDLLNADEADEVLVLCVNVAQGEATALLLSAMFEDLENERVEMVWKQGEMRRISDFWKN
jgi:hypothetical protein